MENKRIEMYVGWTCNQKCTYCREFEHMEKSWDKKVTKYDILKKLIKYKKLGYNHVTYLGGEPFIQGVFENALKFGKKLGYKVLVTTNATTLHIESQAKKYLKYIDELILSFEAISFDSQQKISRTKVVVHWDKVFENIKKFWNGNYLKVNIVITQDNKIDLLNMVKFLNKKNIKNISITYPDIGKNYYEENHIINSIMPKYKELSDILIDILIFCKENNINLKIVDFPFCIFPQNYIEEISELSDDFDYSERLKIEAEDEEDLRNDIDLPRERAQIAKCDGCSYSDICWGPGKKYIELYGDNEINAI